MKLDPSTPALLPPGVIRPLPLNWGQTTAALLTCGLLRLVASSIRIRGAIPESVSQLVSQKRVIFCIWHNRLALAPKLYAYFAQLQKRPPRLAAMVSASQDGGVLARILTHFHIQPVRGSSSRRGPQALLELTSWADQDYDLAITPDGPRGPCYAVQSGVISLAQLTRLPIVPVSYRVSWKMRLRSWDKFQVPLPFGVCHLRLGHPLEVPRKTSPEARESLRLELRQRMMELTED